MNINKKMKKFAKILAASLVITSFCPTVSGLPVQVNSSVEVQLQAASQNKLYM